MSRQEQQERMHARQLQSSTKGQGHHGHPRRQTRFWVVDWSCQRTWMLQKTHFQFGGVWSDTDVLSRLAIVSLIPPHFVGLPGKLLVRGNHILIYGDDALETANFHRLIMNKVTMMFHLSRRMHSPFPRICQWGPWAGARANRNKGKLSPQHFWCSCFAARTIKNLHSC